MHFPIRQIGAGELPELLSHISDPPKTLRVRGSIPKHSAALAIVGSRKHSTYGRAACERLIEGLRDYPVLIVSGLALGIDGIAHEAALRAGLPTAAVLPSGAADGSLYPPSHRNLARRILEGGGALLSEFEDNFSPQAWSFPQRNRIMAGMSHATLIVEASERSGTLITARLALEYNREVLVIPHPIGTDMGAGGNRLLREGATLIRSAEDILESLGLAPNEKETVAPAHLSSDEQAVFDALLEPLEREELMERTQLPATRANIAISSLLIKGLACERMGKIERI